MIRLITELSIYGIQNKALDWFKSYLHNRTQYCRVNSATSSTRKIRCGVPQGSNLGPLLFLLYVNDLPNCLDKSCPAMYADDTNLTVCSDSINNLEEALNSEMKNNHQLLLSNKLTLNIEKTKYMIIGTRQRLAKIQENTSVSCGGKLLKQVYSKKTLGVLIDDNLCWNEQIDNISKKVSKGIGMLRRAKPFVSFETLKYIYQALVQPSFDYCSMVWGNCGEGSKEKLQRLQNRAARVITGDTYEIRSTDILKKLNWKTLEERRKEQKLAYVAKALSNQCPENVSTMFKISNSDKYNLRSNNKMLILSKPKTNSMKRTFGYAAAKDWNYNSKNYKSIYL